MTRGHIKEKAWAELLKQIPLGRVGRPEDVAPRGVVPLLRGAGYITGHVIRVNGGCSYHSSNQAPCGR